jgi:hypothetical protein
VALFKKPKNSQENTSKTAKKVDVAKESKSQQKMILSNVYKMIKFAALLNVLFRTRF